MSILHINSSEIDPSVFTEMVDRHADLETTRQLVRLCRLKLGSVLHRLESPNLDADGLNLVRDRVDDVDNEIRLLIETVQRVMDN